MTTNLLRAGALSCALLATTSLTTFPALAQTTPAYRNFDANGVDLTHGDYRMSMVEGAIGSGEAELALLRDGAWNSGFNGHFWDSVLLNEAMGSRSVSSGGRAEYFTGTTSQQANGATLTLSGSSYIHRAADGTTTYFTRYNPNCTPSPSSQCLWVPESITAPDGKTVSLSWEQWLVCPDVPIGEEVICTVDSLRLSRVSNSHGYSIAFTYADPSPGGGAAGPTPDWFRRTRADFYNNVAGSTAQGSVTYAYPTVNVTEVTDMGGRVWRITGGAHLITGIRRPGAASDTTTISRWGGYVSSVTRDGVTTSYNRTVSGSTATMTVTNALSQSTTIVSDLTIGRPTSITDPLSRTTSYQYDGAGRLTRVTQPEGNYVQYTLDARGNVTQTQAVAKSGSGLAAITTSASYDASCVNPVTCNQPNSSTDARGNVTDYTYDATHGGVLTATAPAAPNGIRPQTRYGYTLTNGEYRLTSVSACQTSAASGSPCAAGAADEVRTTIAYDANGNATSVTSGDGAGTLSATETRTYDALGDLITVDGPLAGSADTVRYRYNAARQLVGTVGPDPDGGGALKHRAQRITYTNGLPTRAERGTVNSQLEGDWAAFSSLEEVQQDYDANARPTVQRLVAGGTTHALSQTSYDGLGRVQCTAQRMNPAEFASLPADACTLDTAGSFGPDRIARTTYDAAGQVTLVQTAYGTADQADEAATSYRPNGQVETVTDGEGNRTTYVYDGHDRLSQTLMPSLTVDGVSSLTDYEQLTYETTAGGARTSGTIASRRLRDGTSITFSYDNLGRLTLRDTPNAVWQDADISYVYDLLGRTTAVTSPIGTNLFFGYDALGRPTSEASCYGTKTMEYDLAGRMTRLTWPDAFYVTYDHLVTGEVSLIREAPVGTGQVLATFGYGDLGQRILLTRGNGTNTSYSYDPVSRLGSLTNDFPGTSGDLTLGFTHNPAGQIATNTRSNDAYAFTAHANQNVTDGLNGLNQVTATGATSVSYDARGNISLIGSVGYGYTSENRMAQGNGTDLLYDPAGRLMLVYTPNQQRLDMLGGSLITELDSSHNVTRRYVHGPGVDEPLVWYEGSGTSDRRWLHADERGSVIAWTDGAGSIVGINEYDEYGVPQTPLAGRFGYTGQAWLPELGLYYYRARMFNPHLGRFMQADPIGYAAGMNLYGYVGGDPVNLTDPGGTCPRGFHLAAPTGSHIMSCVADSGGTAAGGNGNGGSAGASGGIGGEGGAGTASGGGGLVGGPLAGGACNGCITGSDAGARASIAHWGGYYRGGVWVSTIRDWASSFADWITSPSNNPLAGSLNPLAQEYGELTAAYDNGEITADQFYATDRRQGVATLTAVSFATGVPSAWAGVSMSGRSYAFMNYGHGMVGQVRFGGGNLILRLDRSRRDLTYHINVESHLWNFNHHIPINPLRW